MSYYVKTGLGTYELRLGKPPVVKETHYEVECPRCGAKPHKRCVGRKTHRERIREQLATRK